MERVLKRVGLTKRARSDTKSEEEIVASQNGVLVRCRRRSKSRRRSAQNSKKTHGLFSIDWESVKECKSSRSSVLTRKFCSKRTDNELYRSNSFKFERFVRGNDESSTLDKKIILCDEYSLPADNVDKKRLIGSLVLNFTDANPSPQTEKTSTFKERSIPQAAETASIVPEDDASCLTSPDREYSQPYTTEQSSETSSDDEPFGHQISIAKPIVLNSPDSFKGENSFLKLGISSPKTEIKRHPSPYYYGDLFKNKPETSIETSQCVTTLPEKPDTTFKSIFRNIGALTTKSHITKKSKSSQRKLRKSGSLENSNSKQPRVKFRKQERQQKNSGVETQSTGLKDAAEVLAATERHIFPACDNCLTGDYGLDDDMSRQRHVYETAFDCLIDKSEDDLDQIDQVANHPALVQLREQTSDATEKNKHRHLLGNVPVHYPKLKQNLINEHSISQELQNMHITEGQLSESCGILSLPPGGYTPSPPSTAPLSAKFQCKDLILNSIRSTPNLPYQSRSRIKDAHLPVKSSRARSTASSSSSFQIPGDAFDKEFENTNIIPVFKGRPRQTIDSTREKVMEIKDRPKRESLPYKRGRDTRKNILEFRRRRPKYSSTESMTTSSSGSMESIKSSTSEGNRSTTSSESRHSSSLSSHSSDSTGIQKFPIIPTTNFHSQSNKLHILSPISDKSSQEPNSETSENNKNNNSQKCSPEEVFIPEMSKTKRRPPQNKNLQNLGFRISDSRIQGSDSGISIHSREELKSTVGLTMVESKNPNSQDFSDLPFDMPKLRRRRAMMLSQDACTSGSTTSIDLWELPFDMPKLRRRLRVQQSHDECTSEESFVQSTVDADREEFPFRPKLSLNLGELGNRHRLSLGFSLNFKLKSSVDSGRTVDINLPLEKQEWFHGAIGRLDAENVLRFLKEGSFLVRNSESTKQDYSLSLKSAKGFMHMRIQKSAVDGCFILGQFSKAFNSIPEMIHHFSMNRLPIRGAEHMCLSQPVAAQLL